MKQKIVKPLVLGLCLSFGLMLMSCGTDTSENGSDVESESASSEDESAEADADVKILTLEDGTEITLTPVEDDSMGIYGYFTCENDGSMWAFGGDNLAVAYTDEDDGSLETYVCSMEFYQGPEDEDGSFYYCVILENTLANTSTYWYVMNVLDEDSNTVGLMLQDPGDEEYYIGLTLVDDTEEEETTETTE